MKKALLIFIIWLFASSAMAAPFWNSAPYTKDGSEPTEFIVVLNGTTYTAVAPFSVDATHTKIHFDLSGKLIDGTNTISAKAKNFWGKESAFSSPLDFNAGKPAAPSSAGFSAE